MRHVLGSLIRAESRAVRCSRPPSAQHPCLHNKRGKHDDSHEGKSAPSEGPVAQTKDQAANANKRTAGLFEELFPEKATDPEAETRLALLKARRLAKITHDTDWWLTRADRPNIAGLSIVVARHLSSTLDQDDFLRLVPSGKNLEGWAVTRGSIQKIIALRQLSTLKRDNVYVLLFASASSALAYVRRAKRIARITEMLGGPGNLSDRRLPQGLVEDGEDARQLMESYSLAPPGQQLSMEVIPKPYSPALTHLVTVGGSVDLVQREEESPAEVVIRTGIRPLSVHQLSRTIRDEEAKRNLAWTSAGYARVKLAIWRPTESEMNYDRTLRNPLHTDAQLTVPLANRRFGSSTLEAYPGQPSPPKDSDAELLGLGTMSFGEQDDADEEFEQTGDEREFHNRTNRDEGPGSGRVFVAGFATATEAKAFAQHFHRQWIDDPRSRDGHKMQLDAEYLW